MLRLVSFFTLNSRANSSFQPIRQCQPNNMTKFDTLIEIKLIVITQFFCELINSLLEIFSSSGRFFVTGFIFFSSRSSEAVAFKTCFKCYVFFCFLGRLFFSSFFTIGGFLPESWWSKSIFPAYGFWIISSVMFTFKPLFKSLSIAGVIWMLE